MDLFDFLSSFFDNLGSDSVTLGEIILTVTSEDANPGPGYDILGALDRLVASDRVRFDSDGTFSGNPPAGYRGNAVRNFVLATIRTRLVDYPEDRGPYTTFNDVFDAIPEKAPERRDRSPRYSASEVANAILALEREGELAIEEGGLLALV